MSADTGLSHAKVHRRLLGLLLLATLSGGCATAVLPGGNLASEPLADASWRFDPVRQVNYEQPVAESQPSRYALEKLSSENLVSQAKEMAGLGAKPDEARQLMAEAQQLYNQAEQTRDQQTLLEAADKFERVAKLWPQSQLAEDALFMAGESFYFADHYPQSNDQFELLVAKYPNSRYLDRVEARRFSVAQYWHALDEHDPQSFFAVNVFNDHYPWRDRRGHALRIYDRIRIDDPTGKLADDATLAFANAHFARGKYMRADQLYSDLRTNFPSSEHQLTAHWLGLQAKLNSYEGPEYSGEALDSAEQLLKQIHRQFPQQVQAQRDQVLRTHAKIRYSQAEREFETARYYDRRNKYRAARFHYDLVVRDYGDTPFASQAQERLQALADKPALPPQRLSWLANIFPGPGREKPLMSPSNTSTR